MTRHERSKPGAATAHSVPPVVVGLLTVCFLALVSTLPAQKQIDAVDGAAVLMGLAGLVAAIGLVSRPSLLVPRSRLGWAWAGVLGWLLLSALLSDRIWASLVGEVTNLLGWFSLVAITLVALGAARYGRGARLALEIVAPLVVFGQIAATVVQLALGDQPRGSLPNSTYLGEAIVLLLPFVMVEDAGPLRLARQHRLILSGAAVITLAASGARVAALVATGWFVWILVSRSGLSRPLKTLAIAATLLAAIAGAFTFARAEVLGSAGVEALGARPRMWRAALDATAARPFLGYGPDGFVAGGVGVTTPELARRTDVIVFRPGSVDPHNLAMWFLVSGGVIGSALLVWAFVELCLRWRARAREGAPVAPGALAVVGALVVFLTAPAALQILPLFGFVLGVSLCRDASSDGEQTRGLRLAGWLILAALSLATFMMTANAATRFALEEHSAQVSPGKVGLAQAAMRVWSLDAHLAHLASLHWGWVAASNPEVASGQPDLAAIEQAFAVDRRDPFVAFERARTLRFYGAPSEAIEQAFLDTFDRWPLYPLARAEYAVLLAQGGRLDEAEAQIAIARLVDRMGDSDTDRIEAIEAAEAEIAKPR